MHRRNETCLFRRDDRWRQIPADAHRVARGNVVVLLKLASQLVIGLDAARVSTLEPRLGYRGCEDRDAPTLG